MYIEENRNITLLQVPEFRSTNEIDFEERDESKWKIAAGLSLFYEKFDYFSKRKDNEFPTKN